MEWLAALLLGPPLVVVYLWTLGALYYDAGRQTIVGVVFAAAWTAALAALLLFAKPFWLAAAISFAIFCLVFVWWQTQAPSHDRNWDANFSELPFIDQHDGELIVHNVRNTVYRSLNDYEVGYETRRYRLSELSAVDLLTVYWGSKWICHPMLVFEFNAAEHLCISIELRYRENQPYEIIPSLFRQNEIIYLAVDERDAILRRTRFDTGIDCYLFRLNLEPDLRRDVFLEYVEQMNNLIEHPSWYNALTKNCTTSVYQQRQGQMQWDWRLIVNGKLDEMLYEWGRLDTSLPFAELKAKSWINGRANDARPEFFSADVRKGLPGFPT